MIARPFAEDLLKRGGEKGEGRKEVHPSGINSGRSDFPEPRYALMWSGPPLSCILRR